MAPESLTDSLRETLALFGDAGRPRTTSEVAEDLDLGRRSTYERLDRLVEHGRLETKKAGASARVWWRPAGDAASGAGDAASGAGDARSADGGPTARGDHSDLVENLPGMVYRCRAEPGWPLEFVGGHREDLFGYDPAALESGAVAWGEDVVHPEDRERAEAAVRAGLEDDGEFGVRYRVRTADGGTRWVHDRGHVVDGGVEGVVTDVTVRRERERTLREERERFQSFVDAVEEYAIFTLDADGTVQTWNSGAARIKGYDREEILGRHFSTFYTREDRDAGVPEDNLAAAAEDGSVEDEGWRVRGDGSRFWAHVTITALRDDDGSLLGYTKVTRDMTDRREREWAVREERNLLENVLEANPTGIGIFDAEGRARRVNRRFAEVLGLDGEEAGEYALGDRPLRDDAGDIVPYPERPGPRALATGERVERRVRVDSGGRTRWLSVTAEPLDGDGGVVVTAADVTPLKERTRRLERQREDLESELEEVVERVDDGFYALDEEFRFTYVNERAEELLDASEEELLGESVWDAFPEARDTPAWDAFHEAIETGEQTGFEVYYEPLEFWVEASVHPSETGLSVHFRDVTERKARERRLERYAGILEAIEEPAYELDEDGRFTFVNEAFVEYAGYDESELLGSHVSMGMDEAVVEEAEALVSAHLAGDETGPVTIEFEVETADGERRPVENRFSVLTDDEGRLEGTAGLLLDVTERRERQRELERYETVVETIDEGVYVVDGDGRFTWVNRAYAEMTGYAPEELVGEHVSLVVDEGVVETARDHEATLRAGEPAPDLVEADLRTADGGSFPAAASFAILDADDGEHRRVGVVRDVAERKRFEQTLTALYDSARDLLGAETEAAVGETVVETATDVLDLPGVGTYRYDEAEDHLYPAERSVEAGFVRGELPTVPPDDSSITGHVYATGEPRRFEDVTDSPYLNTDATEMRAGVFAPMGDHGVLIVGSRAAGAFDDRTQQLVELLAENAAAAYDRVERERDLKQYETIVESIEEGVYVVDDELRFAWVNGAYADMLGYDPDDLVGEHVMKVVDDGTVAAATEYEARLRAWDDDPGIVEADLRTADGGRVPAAGTFATIPGEDGPDRRVGVARDVTERRQYEEALTGLYDASRGLFRAETESEVTDTVVETARDVIDVPGVAAYRYDEGEDHLYPAAQSVEPGFDREDLPAVPADDSSITGHVHATGELRLFDDVTDSPHFRSDASEVRSSVFAPMGDHGVLVAGSRAVGAFDDRTRQLVELLAENAAAAYDRVERERELEESERRYRTLVDNFPNGAVVLFDEDLRYLTVGGEIYDGLDFSAEDLEGDAMADRLPEELAEELGPRYRAVFDGEAREFEVEFDGEVRRFRVLPVHDEDGAVFAGMAMTQDVTWRRERERELERQREHLTALNNLNDVVREITDAVVDQSTREEIEETVCEHLADTDSYLFAWIGEVDVASETVALRTGAGVEGTPDGVDLSVDPDDEHGGGPVAEALRTGEMRTTRDVASDPEHEPWRDPAEEHDVRSSAAIPIVNDDTVYGVLNVHADRPDAFEGEERAVVGQLGEVVGHAIAAAERKRALMSDEVVELEFRIRDVFDGLDVGDASEGTVTLDRAVPVEDGEFVVYGTATADAVAAVEALVDELPHWTHATFRSEGGETDFELRLSDPPVLSRVASMGGSVEGAVYEDGDFRMTLHLSPTADVRRVIDAVEGAYPTAEMVKRRQTTREAPRAVHGVFAAELTDRQRVALEAAYHAGFYEWPREVSGGDVAESLGVSPPTFHQHLRKAERKVLESALATPGTAT